MKGLQLLRNPADWKRHVDTIKVNLPENSSVVGNGPQCYPCLVASYAPGDDRLVHCFVYPADAAELMAATRAESHGVTVAVQEQLREIRETLKTVKTISSIDQEHCRFVAAHLLTIVNFLVETSICKESQYEQRFQKFLAVADQIGEQERLDAATLLANRKLPG